MSNDQPRQSNGKSDAAMSEDERVTRFETAYNRIDHALTNLVESGGGRRKHSFTAKVRIAANRQRRLARFADFLIEIGELRNALVHSRTGEDTYIAVPMAETVLELEKIEQELFSPQRVVPQFQRKVLTLKPDQTLAEVLRLIRDDGFSRYPVYAREGFVGLLTSNGIARWAAGHVENDHLELDLTEITVSDVLARDHRKDRVAFVSRDELLDNVDTLFSREKQLEAVLITESGKSHQKPIGMICAPDIAALGR